MPEQTHCKEDTQIIIIEQIVTAFYTVATADFLIGYHFRKIQTAQGNNPLVPPITAFSEHIPRIVEFWSIILLKKNRAPQTSSFNLNETHRLLQIRPGEIGRWVKLFRETLDLFARQLPEQKEFIETWWRQIKSFEKLANKNFF